MGSIRRGGRHGIGPREGHMGRIREVEGVDRIQGRLQE